LHRLDGDEQFEIIFLKKVLAIVLPFVGESEQVTASCSDDQLIRLIQTLCTGSKVWNESIGGTSEAGGVKESNDVLVGLLNSPDRSFVRQSQAERHQFQDPSRLITLVPVLKEKLAKACLVALFRLCDRREFLLPLNSNPDSFIQMAPAIHSRIAHLALPILIDRSRSALRAYAADKPMHGMCPFPRIRNEETCYILSLLLDLNLMPGTLSDILVTQGKGRACLKGLRTFRTHEAES
jgi:hypothetical protein